ncbi:unnamed protein product [Didymodactylos carnosus]|uniref:Ammonium transporter n=1 Tax=Didymodactylos carnosus TaxID=1234261 RepID=A0A8S2I4S9_9BILA|nr:unnamed protein product [Didymodactylos carnosus]CAF3711445.1 unnamed protein product [Didymodactylos carnosus]
MVPGIGFFYSGMSKRKNALSLLWLSLMTVAVVSFEWFFWGYSLSFSKTGSKFIGNLDNFALMGVLNGPCVGSGKVPDIVFMIFQCMFACTSPCIAIGAVCGRGRMWPALIFMFVWSTLVYNPVAYWIWSQNGWASVLGVYDFAGGIPVHTISGTAALVYSFFLGPRNAINSNHKSDNIAHIVLGTTLSWFGWFGFNGGSTLSANARAGMACTVTNLAASVAGVTWCMLDYYLLNKNERKFTTFGFCMGSMAGLVVITPASGFVGAPASILIGSLAAVCVYFGRKMKTLLKIDDPFDIFAQHAIGGLMGTLLTGIFAQKSIAALDGTSVINGGWLDRNWLQLAYQFAFCVSGFGWSLVITFLILFVMNKIFVLRVDEQIEYVGIDVEEFGEFTNDYVEFERDLSLRHTSSPPQFIQQHPPPVVNNDYSINNCSTMSEYCNNCYCCGYYCVPRYKRLVNNVFPQNPQAGLDKNNLERLRFYAVVKPEKLDKSFRYMAEKVARYLRHNNRQYVILGVKAMNDTMKSCYQQLNSFVDHYLDALRLVLEEKNDLELTEHAVLSFESFCEIREEAPNYQRNYEFFVDRFTELCHNNDEQNKTKFRCLGLRGHHALIRKTANDELQNDVWRHMDKIVPSIIYNMNVKNSRPQDDLSQSVTPDQVELVEKNDPSILAENVLRDLFCRAHLNNITACVQPILTV